MPIASKQTTSINPKAFLSKVDGGEKMIKAQKKQIIFSQGDPADSVFYILEGKIKLTVVSQKGKEAILAILGREHFFGEGCLTTQRVRMATATSTENATIVRIEKAAMVRVLNEDLIFSGLFMSHVLSRNIRIEEDLVDQLFNSSEKRLARLLLLFSNFGNEGKTQAIIPKISQEALAEMFGTTRPRINFFMNKFRKLGFIEYNGGLKIHSSLLNIVLHD